MKINLNQLVGSLPAFQELQNVRFLPKTSLNIYKLAKSIQKELGEFDKKRNAIYSANGIPQVDGRFDPKDVAPEIIQKVDQEVNNLIADDIQLKPDFKIPFEELERAIQSSGTNFSPLMIQNLEWLLDSGEEEDILEL